METPDNTASQGPLNYELRLKSAQTLNPKPRRKPSNAPDPQSRDLKPPKAEDPETTGFLLRD